MNRDLLGWARRTSGLSVADAASGLGVSEATLERWESGDLAPTIKQLRKAAARYKRPLAVLLLSEPPLDFQPIKDFRRIQAATSRDWSSRLRFEFRRAISQREVFLELDELAPASVQRRDTPPAIPVDADSEEAGRHLRDALALDTKPLPLVSPNETLNSVVERVEELGVLVIQTKGVDISEMRGFSISEWPFPVIAVNGSDWPRPRVFTLLHELCHLALNAGGLCDLHETSKTPRAEDQVEHQCNQIAAATLMPEHLLLKDVGARGSGAGYAWSVEELEVLSKRFGTSIESTLLRLITIERAGWDLYRTLKPELDMRYAEARKRRKQRQQESPGGPSFYVIKARDLGHTYVNSVLDAYRSQAISSLDVADYLDVRFDQLRKLEEVT